MPTSNAVRSDVSIVCTCGAGIHLAEVPHTSHVICPECPRVLKVMVQPVVTECGEGEASVVVDRGDRKEIRPDFRLRIRDDEGNFAEPVGNPHLEAEAFRRAGIHLLGLEKIREIAEGDEGDAAEVAKACLVAWGSQASQTDPATQGSPSLPPQTPE